MRLISTYIGEQATKTRAEVHNNNNVYEVHYYNNRGELFKTENFASVQTAQNIAETWASTIQVLKE
jgi:hypothetical protein